jgi:hypothetical protein
MGPLRIIGTIAGVVVATYGIAGNTVTILATRPETIAENSTVWVAWVGQQLPWLNGPWDGLPFNVLAIVAGGTLAAALNIPWRYFARPAVPVQGVEADPGPRLYAGEGDPFRGEKVMPGDADLIYRIAIEAPVGKAFRGIRVEVQECSPPGAFAIGTPFRLMHEWYDTLRGFDLGGGQTKYLELFDARVKRRRVAQVQPAHAVRVKPRVVNKGTYVATFKVTGPDITNPLIQQFRIVVDTNSDSPVAIASNPSVIS